MPFELKLLPCSSDLLLQSLELASPLLELLICVPVPLLLLGDFLVPELRLPPQPPTLLELAPGFLPLLRFPLGFLFVPLALDLFKSQALKSLVFNALFRITQLILFALLLFEPQALETLLCFLSLAHLSSEVTEGKGGHQKNHAKNCIQAERQQVLRTHHIVNYN